MSRSRVSLSDSGLYLAYVVKIFTGLILAVSFVAVLIPPHGVKAIMSACGIVEPKNNAVQAPPVKRCEVCGQPGDAVFYSGEGAAGVRYYCSSHKFSAPTTMSVPKYGGRTTEQIKRDNDLSYFFFGWVLPIGIVILSITQLVKAHVLDDYENTAVSTATFFVKAVILLLVTLLTACLRSGSR